MTKWTLVLTVGIVALTACSGRGTCPSTVHDGTSCAGEDLQCPYAAQVLACDGTTVTIQSSCSCVNGTWSCPGKQTAACVSTDGGTSTGGGGPGTYTSVAEAAAPAAPTYKGKNSSCPLVYPWDGTKFVYDTDVGGLTLSIPAEATANRAIPLLGGGTFYHLLRRAVFDTTSGLEIRLRESVGEISYIDEARLLLVDHPADTELYSSGDESTNEWGYVNPFTAYTVRDARLPLSAADRAGNDVISYLTAVDNVPAPVDPATLDNDYTLDFGPIRDPAHAKLVIDGWSVYLVRSSSDVQPCVEAESAGVWTTVTKFGAPYGDFKTIVVDLSGKLPAGAQRLRVHLGVETGARWAMDRVRLDESAPEQTTVTKLDAARADLAHRGRATIFRPTMLTRQDALDDESPDDPVQVGYGAFTRYGDVRELLTALDDRYVVLRHGDQITLAFPGTPAPAAGTVRSVVLQVDVSMKTFFYGPMVEPLPFHGMSAYPYPPTEAYPNDAVHQQFLVDYQTRVYPLPSH